jgi:hypothetical protein
MTRFVARLVLTLTLAPHAFGLVAPGNGAGAVRLGELPSARAEDVGGRFWKREWGDVRSIGRGSEGGSLCARSDDYKCWQ